MNDNTLIQQISTTSKTTCKTHHGSHHQLQKHANIHQKNSRQSSTRLWQHRTQPGKRNPQNLHQTNHEQLENLAQHDPQGSSALTGQHNAITKRIFTQLILQLLQCPHQGAERLNYFTTFRDGIKGIVKILNYTGHPQRRNKKKKDMTRKLHTFKSKQAIVMAHSVSSIVTRHTLNGLANYLITMINIIKNEE